MGRGRRLVALIVAAIGTLFVQDALAQGPTVGLENQPAPGSLSSSLGPTPGAGQSPFGPSPGADAIYLGGRPGTSSPRVPTSIATPGVVALPAAPIGIRAPAVLPITDVPVYGPLEMPETAEVEGPTDGMTLEMALDRLVAESLYLRSTFTQVSKARADILTASLRANPILYADSQLQPYGRYSRALNGGPAQYDVNVQHPIDLSRKRSARTIAAECAVNTMEAQYQNAVRLEIQNLYTVFVDVLSARETVRYAEASIEGLNKVLTANELLYKRSNTARPDVDRIRILLQRAKLGRDEALETLQRTKRTLALLLNLPIAAAETLDVRGMLVDVFPAPPPHDELIRIAVLSRADLSAQQLGVTHARANVDLALANRFADAYVLYQPYTFQDNSPFGLKSSTSWALGATVPVPVFNRNQGGVLRARLSVDHNQAQTLALARQIVTEVEQAEREYKVTRDAAERLGRASLTARLMRDDTLRLFVRGDLDARATYNAQRDYNEVVRAYRTLVVRHRRSMLNLNTAVGQRILP